MKNTRRLICLLLVVLLLPFSSALPVEADAYTHHCSCGTRQEEVDVWGYVCSNRSVIMRCPTCNAMNPFFRSPSVPHTPTQLLRFDESDQVTQRTVCAHCGDEIDSAKAVPDQAGLELDGFIYDTYSEPLGAVITGWTGDADTLTIPQALGGLTVLAIAPGAFENAKLREVTIEESVLVLGQRAFAGCAQLESIWLPDSLVGIYAEAFYDCVSLRHFDYPKNWCLAENHIFWNCHSLTQVDIPVGITQVPAFAFAEAFSLAQVTLPEGLTHIGRDAFSYTALETVTVPKSLVFIGDRAFQGCKSLVSIELTDSITNIGAYAFYFCEKLESITLPSKLKRIAEGCFSRCGSLESVVIPQGVVWIRHEAFQYCYSLASVVIPKSVKVIHDYAFSECTRLAQIYYGGTEKQWKQVRLAAYYYEEEIALGMVGLGDSKLTFIWNACPHIQWTQKDDAVHSYSCSKCGVRGKSEHVWAKPAMGKEPTTKEAGYLDLRCQLCGGHKQQPVPAIDVSGPQVAATSDNRNSRDTSLLQPVADGWLRVEALEDSVTVEKYDKNWKLVYRTTLAMELPIFGGFCLGQEENYLIFGQENPEEDEQKEVIRVVKYSANWTRMDSVSLCNEQFRDKIMYPFRSLEMEILNGYLELFAICDLGGYQNSPVAGAWMGRIRLADMNYDIEQDYFGAPVSQIRMVSDGENLYRMALHEGNVLVDQEYQHKGDVQGYNRQNLTLDLPVGYVTVLGDPAVTDSHILIPGAGNDGRLFIAALPRDSFAKDAIAIYYVEDPGVLAGSSPSVTVTEQGNLLLWATEDGLGWCCVEDDGALSGDVFHGAGDLSNCKPTEKAGTLYWYVTADSQPTFYSLDLAAPQAVTRICNHIYRDGFCALCGKEAPEGILGDANGDGVVNYRDALLTLRFSVGLDVLENEALADFNADGAVNYRDALAILRYSVGLA